MPRTPSRPSATHSAMAMGVSVLSRVWPSRPPRRDRSFAQAGFLLVGPLQAERRRILLEPGGREGLDLQGVEGESPKHAVELGGTQRLEDLPQPVIMERGACEAGLEQGEHPTLLQ